MALCRSSSCSSRSDVLLKAKLASISKSQGGLDPNCKGPIIVLRQANDVWFVWESLLRPQHVLGNEACAHNQSAGLSAWKCSSEESGWDPDLPSEWRRACQLECNVMLSALACIIFSLAVICVGVEAYGKYDPCNTPGLASRVSRSAERGSKSQDSCCQMHTDHKVKLYELELDMAMMQKVMARRRNHLQETKIPFPGKSLALQPSAINDRPTFAAVRWDQVSMCNYSI